MFRFETLEIWKRSIVLTDKIFEIAEMIDKKHYFRFAEQIRASALSVSNNIAEGAGSDSVKEFKQFLNYSRRSIFETVNMLIIAERRNIIDGILREKIINELEGISKMVISFSRSLSARHS
jgi:four helix bundle protein